MESCCTNPPLSPHTPTFRLGPGYWATVPEGQRADVMRHHLQRALRLAKDYQLPLPASQEKRFELVVLLALEAELLFFNAAVWNHRRTTGTRFSPTFFGVLCGPLRQMSSREGMASLSFSPEINTLLVIEGKTWFPATKGAN